MKRRGEQRSGEGSKGETRGGRRLVVKVAAMVFQAQEFLDEDGRLWYEVWDLPGRSLAARTVDTCSGAAPDGRGGSRNGLAGSPFLHSREASGGVSSGGSRPGGSVGLNLELQRDGRRENSS